MCLGAVVVSSSECRYAPPGALSVAELVAATGAHLAAGSNEGAWSLCTDSREMSDQMIFVALVGDLHDGHRFVEQVLSDFKCGALVQRGRLGSDFVLPEALGGPLLEVEDTLVAFGEAAGAFLRRQRPPVAAITGSVGKTTTRAMLGAILECEGPGLQTDGNFNNRIGLPLTLLRLEPEHQWAVVELGMSEPGEILALAQIAKPQVRVITEVVAAHLEFFPSVEAIADAKGELFAEAIAGDVLVFPMDNPLARRFPKPPGTRSLPFSLCPDSDAPVRALHIEPLGREGSRVRMALAAEEVEVHIRLVGAHQVHNALAAAAAAVGMGVGPATIREGLESVNVPGRRMRISERGGVTIVDDAYNANPASMAAAFRALSDLETEGRRAAAVGDMLELGSTGSQLHAEVGELAAHLGIDLLVGVGPLMEHAVRAARAAGIEAEVANDSRAAGELLGAWLSPGDLVLLKGSRGMRMESAIEFLPGDEGN
ncbi:MAG: UDP-N-acetylmuramoylalanyl-D-glutamyl-2, 6-diaminopimelate--D-alanyl-D-alanine ligase [Deltaproteobacteria bacterium]|nr:UDP-N-acetylmuramoylalanyl-D-glutamyl-2, 6-diaminopimelate--D-alanyl-D-alanine ligase [Deltaproteobacteria bacterium]